MDNDEIGKEIKGLRTDVRTVLVEVGILKTEVGNLNRIWRWISKSTMVACLGVLGTWAKAKFW